jgi:hypothetical protein
MEKRKKGLVCGLLLWVVFLTAGCGQIEKGRKTDGGTRVLILYDTGEKQLEEIAAGIQEKMGGDRASILAAPDITAYDLILVGGKNQEGSLSEEVKSYLEATDLKGKRISPFWLEEEGQAERAEDQYEIQFGQAVKNGVVMPGISLTWNESRKAEESGRIDGWLTTACTLKIKEEETFHQPDVSSSFV